VGLTGEGDHRTFSPDSSFSAGDVICRDAFRSLVATQTNPQKIDDSQMIRVGRCNQPDVVLYARSVGVSGRNVDLYVKTSDNRYHQVRSTFK
jgi:hypothetical protein